MKQAKRRSLRTAVCATVLPLLLSSCAWFGSLTDDEDEALQPAELVDFDPEITVKRLWTASVGKGQGKKYHNLVPAMDGDSIYVASADGKVMALDAESGKRRWRVDVDSPVSGATGLGSGLVLLGTESGEVVALDQRDGGELWRTQLSSEVLAAPAADDDIVVAQTFDGNIYGLDGGDGTDLWRFETTLPVLTLRGNAAPQVADDEVYAAFSNGKIVALELQTGSMRWEARLAAPQGQSEIERIIDIDGAPLLLGGNLYAVSYQGRAGSFDRISGRPVWMVEASSYERVTEGLGNIIISGADGRVIARDVGSGAVRWQQEQLLRRNLSSPTAFRSWVAVADFEGYVHLLSLLDGRIVGRFRADRAGVRAEMLARGDRLFVYGNGGDLKAYRVSPR